MRLHYWVDVNSGPCGSGSGTLLTVLVRKCQPVRRMGGQMEEWHLNTCCLGLNMGLCVLVGAEGRWGDLSEQVSSFHVLTLYKEVLGAQKIQPWESETTPAQSANDSRTCPKVQPIFEEQHWPKNVVRVVKLWGWLFHFISPGQHKWAKTN